MAWEAFDVETSGQQPEYGLQPWRAKTQQGWLRSWAVAQRDTTRVYVATTYLETRKQLRRLTDRWADEGTTVCTWNGPFDIAWLIAYEQRKACAKIKWLDGQLLWRHLTQIPTYGPRQSWTLKDAVREFLPRYGGYEDDVDFEGDLLPLIAYNAADARFTRIITKYLYDQLAQEPRRLRAALIEAHCLADVAYANYSGVPINSSAVKVLSEELLSTKADLELQLAEHGLTETILSSPTQLGEVIFGEWGLKPLKVGKTGPSTDKETLLELAVHDDRMLLVHQWREAKGNWKKFVDNVGASVEYNNDKHSHPSARPFGTYTGRFTYSSKQGKGVAAAQTGFALHQMKRDNRYRALVQAPPRYVIVELDASGQEFRWMAELSGDDTMRKLCLPGEDPHSYMGAQVAGVGYQEVIEGARAGDKVLKGFRQLGKVTNLSFQFRTSAKTATRTARINFGMMDMTVQQMALVREIYLRTYRGVPQYWRRQIAFVKQHYYVETLAGRRVTIPKDWVRKYEWSVESTSINYPVQGTGGDQKYLAMSVIRPVLHELSVQFLFDLHDGLYFLVPTSCADKFVQTARALFNHLPYQKAWGITPSIPLPWDVKMGTSWGNMTEIEA